MHSCLPARYEDAFRTVAEDQEAIEVHVYQGESRSLAHNQSIGRFLLSGLNQCADADGRIIVRFDLTLDGTLNVTARESRSGLSKSIAIQNANSRFDQAARDAASEHLESMFPASDEFHDPREFARQDGADPQTPGPWAPSAGSNRLDELLGKARAARAHPTPEDVEEIDQLIESIEQGRLQDNAPILAALETELDDLLYYVVG